MQGDHLADLIADGVDRIERGHRLLEHDGDFPGANFVHLVRRQRNEVAALPQDLPAGDAAGRHRDQLQDRHRGDGLAAAGFADHADCLAARDGEIDAIHGLHDAVVGGEVGLESPDVEQRGFACGLRVDIHHRRVSRHLHDFPGIERVAQPVADEIDREHGQENRRTRKQRPMRRNVEIILGVE